MAVSFDYKRRLGSGYFGEVWYAVDTGLNCEVALKCIPPDKIINQNNFYQEAQVLKASEHPNIVKVNDTGNLKDGRIYVSMEYLPRGSLEDEAQGAYLPLSRARKIMIDVLRGLAHAHSISVVHRDVKPANILIGNSGEGKLSDFGLALPNIQSLSMNKLKEYQYFLHLAPEVRKIHDYTFLSDIYACGVTLYRLVNGDSQLPQISPQEVHRRAREGVFPPRDRYRDFIPQPLKRLINKALNVDPGKRFKSAVEMRHALEQQSLVVDWEAISTGHYGNVWTGTNLKGSVYKLSKLQKDNGKWMVEVKKGNSLDSMRRIVKHCCYGMRKQDADKRARRILQDFVLGRN